MDDFSFTADNGRRFSRGGFPAMISASVEDNGDEGEEDKGDEEREPGGARHWVPGSVGVFNAEK